MKRVVMTWSETFPNDDIVLAVRAKDIVRASGEFPIGAQIIGSHFPIQGLSAMFELPWIGRRTQADIIISHNFTPLFGRSAVFIQDFLFLSNPGWFTLKERAYFSLMRRTMGRATYVFSSSVTEGKRIQSYSKRRIKPVAVGLAANAQVVRSERRRPEELGHMQGFFLSVGRLNIRKNLETILISAAKSGRISPDFPLIVVGEPSGRTAPLPQSVVEVVETGAIKFLGFISDEELAWLYANATLFIFLSLDEGFGMPPLEASAFGTPMLVSDIPVFREILQDSASYVDPLDIEAVASAIAELPPNASTLGDGHDSPTTRYTWTGCVQRMRGEIVGKIEKGEFWNEA